MQFDYDLVGKIGSMALIRPEDNDIDYNILSRIGAELKPGMIWVSSGATEIGRIDYMKRNGGQALFGATEDIKTDYAAQGQAILMNNYRMFVPAQYSIRQVLVEHGHFNDATKREHIRQLLLRASRQGAIPIVNYNDPVSNEETRRMEILSLRNADSGVVECVDNDETAAVISILVRARTLLVLSNIEGVYKDAKDPSTLVQEVCATNAEELERKVEELILSCVGASREGANGAGAKLRYVLPFIRGRPVPVHSIRAASWRVFCSS